MTENMKIPSGKNKCQNLKNHVQAKAAGFKRMPEDVGISHNKKHPNNFHPKRIGGIFEKNIENATNLAILRSHFGTINPKP